MIFGPFPASFVDDSHEIAFAIVLMGLVGSMIIVAFVKHNTYQSILTSRFGVLHSFEPEFVIDISVEENIVQKVIFEFHL